MQKIKKGDEVVVLAGRDKGRQGVVQKILSKGRTFVEGINLVKKHTKGNPQQGTAGGILEKEASIHLSNIAVFNPLTKKADRVGIKTLEDGRKVRYFKSNGELVDV